MKQLLKSVGRKISNTLKPIDVDEEYIDDDDEFDYEVEEQPQKDGLLARLGSRITLGDTILISALIIYQSNIVEFYYLILGVIVLLYAFMFGETIRWRRKS